MDVIILAAGRGSRLKGIAPPYHKPLMVVDGKPLILGALEVAHRVRTSSTVVVVAPENALPICQLIDDAGADYSDVRVVVQRNSRGPGAAFIEGWRASDRTETTMLLMGDNTFDNAEVNTVCNKASHDRVVVGGRWVLPGDLLTRFTRVHGSGVGARFAEGDLFENEPPNPFLWCGPLVLNGKALCDVLMGIEKHEAVPELKLGRYLGYLEANVHLVEVSSKDVGTEADLVPKAES